MALLLLTPDKIATALLEEAGGTPSEQKALPLLNNPGNNLEPARWMPALVITTGEENTVYFKALLIWCAFKGPTTDS